MLQDFQTSLDNISLWAATNNMIINAQKTQQIQSHTIELVAGLWKKGHTAYINADTNFSKFTTISFHYLIL